MIEMRRAQLSFGDGLIAEEVSDLREGWMKHADAVLADEGLCTRLWQVGMPRAAAAAGEVHRPRWCCGC
jgi:transposase, IS5 family